MEPHNLAFDSGDILIKFREFPPIEIRESRNPTLCTQGEELAIQFFAQEVASHDEPENTLGAIREAGHPVLCSCRMPLPTRPWRGPK